MVVPLAAQGQVRAVISFARVSSRRGFTDDDLQSATEFARQAMVALELVEARHAERALAVMDDRERIARDLHEHIVQELFALSMGVRNLACVSDRADHAVRLNRYVDTIDGVITDIRTSIFRLQPRRHDHQGLQSRLLDLVDSYVEPLGFTARARFRGALDLAVDPDLAEDVLAVAREGLSNCARHAQASSVDLSVTVINDRLTVQIADNGVGPGNPTRSSGLTNLRTRAEQNHGTLAVQAVDGGGTRLTWAVRLPDH